MAEHAHGHHEHGHGHAHGHGHGHGHGHAHDHWDGDEYLTKPGIKETAASSADNVFYALQRAGLEKHDLVNLDLLEVGCGPGLVTALVAPSFGSVHSIDVSASMLKTFAKQPAASLPNVTYSQHTLHAGSGDDFVRGTPQPSPTPTDPERKERPPREKFDVAIANLVVHHVDNLDQFFKGLMSILKPGGKLILTEFTTLPNGRDPIAEVREKNAAKHAKPEGTVNAPNVVSMTFNPDLLGAILNKYGFENVGGDRRGTILIGEDKDEIPTLYMYASKPK